MERLLRIITAERVTRTRREVVDAATLATAQEIIDDVRQGGEAALRRQGERLGDLRTGEAMVLGPTELARAAAAVPRADVELLERTARSIERFARAQREAIGGVVVSVPGGEAGHAVSPVAAAGCYAPGGRFPLPSSVLMTAVTARVAGVSRVVVASPRPTAVTLAAAHVAGADLVLAVGGAQACAAMALGVGVPRCDVIVGPGNRFVTAAKKLLMGTVGIDMLAGPSELVVLADDTAEAATVAADLLAQAEHDDDALPVLVTTSAALVDAVERELEAQLGTLPTAPTARAALRNGFAVVCGDLAEAIRVTDELAPEHLEVVTRDATKVAGSVRNYGGVFVGPGSAEVFGDYGIGPNHVLPTSGTARFAAGLSVLHFVRVRTWLNVRPTREVVADTARLARLEGLEAHARAAERRAVP